MRFRTSTRVLSLTAMCGVTGVLWTGCTASKQTELVPGMSTQVRVPRDMKSIRVDVLSGGVSTFCGVYDVTNGIARLPKTLALQDANKGGPVTVIVTGFSVGPTEAADNETQLALTACPVSPIPTVKDATHASGIARVLRASRTPYVADHVKYLPMPLRFSCFDTQCDGDMTCKAGQCVPMDVDGASLVDYNDNLVFGNSSTCFSPAACLVDGAAPVEIDRATCTFALVGTAGAPDALPGFPKTNGSGLNVRAYYDDRSVNEVLDYDRDEGYVVPDPARPQTFRLSPGLCKLLHPDPSAAPPAHRITSLVASGLCPSKTPLQPICDAESPSNPDSDASAGDDPQNNGCFAQEIKPSPSALVVVLDDTTDMQSFYTSSGAKTVLNLSLQDPVFENTVIALQFFPHTGDTCSSSTTLDAPFKFAREAQSDIATKLTNTPLLSPASRRLDLAAQSAYAQIGALTGKFSKLGVLVLSDGSFGAECAGNDLTAMAGAHHAAARPIETYTILLGRQDSVANPGGLAGANQVATSGGTGLAFNADAKTGGDPVRGLDALAQVTSDLATCLYELPGNVCKFTGGNVACSGATGLSGTGDVTYFNPVLGQTGTVRVKYNAACGVEQDANGWSRTPDNRVRICGSDCTALRGAMKTSSTLAAALGTPPPAMPIFVTNCAGKPATPATDGGVDSGSTGTDAATDAHGGSDAGIADASTD